MPVRKKVKRFVIDVNAFVTLFINKELSWLFDYIDQNRIEIFIDRNLVDELSRVLDYPRVKKLLPSGKHLYINFVKLISTYIHSSVHDIHCPDPEDNYLYDLALSANAKLLVSGEKALLDWKDSPVETINLATFKELF